MSARREMRKARRAYELARLAALIEENQRRLDEREAERNAPCKLCVEFGLIRPVSA